MIHHFLIADVCNTLQCQTNKDGVATREVILDVLDNQFDQFTVSTDEDGYKKVSLQKLTKTGILSNHKTA